MTRAAVLLLDPRYAHNVGSALRACALLGAGDLYWTGKRVPPIEDWPRGQRLPREERMKCYQRVELTHLDTVNRLPAFRSDCRSAVAPVCVEISDSAEDLRDFVHPEMPLYVFGPEDGGVPKGIRTVCHRFLRIPVAIPVEDPDSRTPYNLATAVSLVLYDRFIKEGIDGLHPGIHARDGRVQRGSEEREFLPSR